MKCHLALNIVPAIFALSVATASTAQPREPAVSILTPRASAVAPIRIGTNCPLTTGSSDMGISVSAALRMIAKELNGAGGILGTPLELVERDDQASPAEGKRIAEQMVKANVLLTIGYCNTGVAAASIETYQKAQVPLIIPVATGSVLTRTFAPPASQKNYIFRTAVPDAQQVEFMVDAILKRGWDKIALFADNTGYGEMGRKDLESALAKRNLSLVHTERFDIGVKDLKGALERARAVGANALFVYTTGPENAVISIGRRELKWKVPHVGPWTVGFGNHLSAAGGAAEGALTVQTFIQDGRHSYDRQAFIRNIARELQDKRIPCAMCAAQAYDAMQLAVRAIGQLKHRGVPLTPQAVRDQLEALDRPIKGVVTTHENPYNADDHEAVSRNMLVLGVVRNGAIAYADPADELRFMIPHRKAAASAAGAGGR